VALELPKSGPLLERAPRMHASAECCVNGGCPSRFCYPLIFVFPRLLLSATRFKKDKAKGMEASLPFPLLFSPSLPSASLRNPNPPTHPNLT